MRNVFSKLSAFVRFFILLQLVSLLIRSAAFKNREYKKRLAKKERSIQIRTENNRISRTYRFKKDRNKLSSNPDAALIWAEPSMAFIAMTSGYDGDVFSAFQSGNAFIEGDAEQIIWFFSMVREAKDILGLS